MRNYFIAAALLAATVSTAQTRDTTRPAGAPQIGNLPADNIRSHKSPEGVEKRLSDLAVANLKQWYQRDYAFMEFLHLEKFVY